jgi:hypothetical protein
MSNSDTMTGNPYWLLIPLIAVIIAVLLWWIRFRNQVSAFVGKMNIPNQIRNRTVSNFLAFIKVSPAKLGRNVALAIRVAILLNFPSWSLIPDIRKTQPHPRKAQMKHDAQWPKLLAACLHLGALCCLLKIVLPFICRRFAHLVPVVGLAQLCSPH